jgi:hypothetical protein
MDFIKQLRLIQADELSSDEDSSFSFVADSTPDHDCSSVSDTTTMTIPERSDGETKASSTKRKRDSVTKSASSGEDAAETSRIAKKAKKTESVSAQKAPVATSEPTQANGTKKLQKRKLDDEKSEKEAEQPRAAKKMKPESEKQVRQVPAKAESSKAASAAPVSPKPVRTMEYFEERVHQMLSDPLGFDDLVHPSSKPVPNYVKRQFAQCRRRQRQPTPPLEMRGALGPAPDAKPPTSKRQVSESLAKGAQKRAHQQKVKERVQSLKGKSVSTNKSSDESDGSAGRKQGGRQQPNSSKKYSTKSAYSEVPTMSGAIASEMPATDADEVPAYDDADEVPTMSGAIAAEILPTDELLQKPSSDAMPAEHSITHDSDGVPTMSGAITTEPTKSGGIAPETPAMSGALTAKISSPDELELFKLLSDAIAAEPETTYDADEVPATSGSTTSPNDTCASNEQQDSTTDAGIQNPHAINDGHRLNTNQDDRVAEVAMV